MGFSGDGIREGLGNAWVEAGFYVDLSNHQPFLKGRHNLENRRTQNTF